MVQSADREAMRCFIGFSVHGPWPALTLRDPLRSVDRHLTLLFLGQQPFDEVLERCRAWCPSLWSAPLLTSGPWLRLPTQDPHVLALSTPPCTEEVPLTQLIEEGRRLFQPPYPERPLHGAAHDDASLPRPWLPHVTLARDPHQAPNPLLLPLWCGDLHLYRSMPQRIYEPVWSWPIPRAFEEFDYPADRAFRCRGKNWPELTLALLWALAQEEPELVQSAAECQMACSQADAVRILNRLLSEAGAHRSIPWKAVTFQGGVEERPEGIVWEVVVDA